MCTQAIQKEKSQVQVTGMIAINDHLLNIFAIAIGKAFPELSDVQAVIAPGANPKFGDYQCNNAMSISKEFKIRGITKSPRDIAVKIVENLDPSPVVEKCEIAGAGFVNIFLNK